jgi:hypothetical protein
MGYTGRPEKEKVVTREPCDPAEAPETEPALPDLVPESVPA